MAFASWAKTSTTGSKPVGGTCSIEADVQVKDGPSDSISALSWSPVSDHLAVSSWDNGVRVYEVGQQGAVGRAAYNHEAPALDVCWSHDGLKAFSGGVDNAGRMLDVQTGQSSQVAQHASPVKSVRWTDMHGGLLVTGSWDKTLKVTGTALSSYDKLTFRPAVLGLADTFSHSVSRLAGAMLLHGLGQEHASGGHSRLSSAARRLEQSWSVRWRACGDPPQIPSTMHSSGAGRFKLCYRWN